MATFYEYGFWGLFAASFIAATIMPFSSEALLSLMILNKFNLPQCLIIATSGNWLGGMTNYGLGYLAKWNWIEKYLRVKKESLNKFHEKVGKYGAFIALFCWLPIVGDPLAIALGVLRVNAMGVAIFMFIGKLLRYLTWIYLTFFVAGFF